MSVVYLQAKDLGKYERRLGENLHRFIGRGMRRGALEIVRILQVETANKQIYDQGGFAGGWNFRQLSELHTKVFNAAKNAPYVEGGRAPNSTPPPAYAIMGWVLRHLGDPQLSFAIAKSIGKKGIAPRPVMYAFGMMGRMTNAMLGHLNDELDRALQETPST
jgi:hypothetical protein